MKVGEKIASYFMMFYVRNLETYKKTKPMIIS